MELEKEVFEQEIRDIDLRLAKECIPAPGRPLQAIISMFQSHNVSGPIASPDKNDLNFPVTAMNLSDHVSAWYEENYRNKIKVDPSRGQFPLIIEGTVFQCRIPLIFGSFTLLAAKGRFSDKQILNAVDHITDLTQHLRERLTEEEAENILAMFATCYSVTNQLGRVQSDFLTSGATDIHVSCELLYGYKTNPSLSAWHSLQFAEKCLKEYISKFEKPKFSHKIEDLVTVAQEHGYAPDKRLNFDLFSFGPSVRYSPNHFGVEQAVSINHEAWKVALDVLTQIQT